VGCGERMVGEGGRAGRREGGREGARVRVRAGGREGGSHGANPTRGQPSRGLGTQFSPPPPPPYASLEHA
jgi:hypothetical protein